MEGLLLIFGVNIKVRSSAGRLPQQYGVCAQKLLYCRPRNTEF
jgi:hypothetical protein